MSFSHLIASAHGGLSERGSLQDHGPGVSGDTSCSDTATVLKQQYTL